MGSRNPRLPRQGSPGLELRLGNQNKRARHRPSPSLTPSSLGGLSVVRQPKHRHMLSLTILLSPEDHGHRPSAADASLTVSFQCMNPLPGTNSSGPSTRITSRMKVTAKFSRLLSYWQLLTHRIMSSLLQFYLHNLVFGYYNQAHKPRRHIHFCGFSSLLQLLHRFCFSSPRWSSVLECIG